MGNIALPTDASARLACEWLGPAFEKRRPVPTTEPLNRFVASLPGAMLAKALGLGLGSVTLDAACASSLYALKLACDALLEGRADAMLTGGVSRPSSLYTQMGFSQLRALSPSGRCSPFDAAADGLVVGEGAGLFVVKRLSDAERDGDRIYGVVRAIGVSNDIDGSLLAPDSSGQLRAMREAYERAGWKPSEVDLIECHATGTPVGDAVEIRSLRTLWGSDGWEPGACAIGSAKSNVGHLLTGAGAAGLTKVLLALRHRTLPPSANFSEPNPQMPLDGSPFRVQTEPEPWPERPDRPRRAAVSAFGFGGINAHVLVEEHRSSPHALAPHPNPSARRLAERESKARVAIVGMEAHFGELESLREFQEAVLSGRPREPKAPSEDRRWGAAGPAPKGFYLRGLGVPAGAFRIPPKELEQMLPQQLLMLDVARRALLDAEGPDGLARRRERGGVFIGIELDPNTNNFHFRWSRPESERDAAHPALTADRTMGALGSIVASRVAREFRFGGPSFTLSSGDGSGLKALEAAAAALSSGELDEALVGAVDLAGDPRALAAEGAARKRSPDGRAMPFDRAAGGAAPGEGAAAVVLKRLDDAIRDGDRVYAVVAGVGAARGEPKAACEAALERAFARAGFEPSDATYLEASGSGVPEEDAAEAQALSTFFPSRPEGPACAPDTRDHVLADASLSAPRIALGSLAPVIGRAGAASGLASLVKAALACYQEILPGFPLASPRGELAGSADRFHAPRTAQYWFRDRADGPRRAVAQCLGFEGNAACVALEGFEGAQPPRADAERRQPLGARSEALFAVEAESAPGLVAALGKLRAWLDGKDAGIAPASGRDDVLADSREAGPTSSPSLRSGLRAQASLTAPGIETLARAWWAETREGWGRKPLAAAFVVRGRPELLDALALAERSLIEDPAAPIQGFEKVFYSPEPNGRQGKLAFVFPGSGNQYVGMGLELGAEWPGIARAQDAENLLLRSQFVPEKYAPWRLSWSGDWEKETVASIGQDPKSLIFGQVAHGVAVSDLIRAFGVQPDAVIGYSLGETAGLFAMRAWKDRDEMFRRMERSSLFVTDLAGPCNAARRTWGLAAHEAVDWALGVVDRPEKLVRSAVSTMENAFLLIVNTPRECVVGGARHAVKRLVEGLGATFLPLEGVTTVHCRVAKVVEKEYRELHLLETQPPQWVKFYSGAWARSYPVDRESAADAIVAQAVDGIDFTAVVTRAYEDGVRVFVELGPRNTCSRMISRTLADRPHMARSACVREQGSVSSVLRLLASLVAERVPVDLDALYGRPTLCVGHRADPPTSDRRLKIPLGRSAVPTAPPPAAKAPAVRPTVATRPPVSAPPAAGPGVARELVAAQSAAAAAHETFLQLSDGLARSQLRLLEFQASLLERAGAGGGSLLVPLAPRPSPPAPLPEKAKLFLTREQCLEFAVGRIGDVLGAAFAEADRFPTRVRLPDEPLMLVDRILEVEGEPKSLSSGRVVTEHDVREGAWYLDQGRIPTCIAVEAGQADLFLSGFLGIDFKTRGLGMYRLLDATVAFHRGLPAPGSTIHYDIRIERFVRHGDIYLFFFNYDSTVDGRPLLTMRNGCAGFFTPRELEAGQGIVLTEEEKHPAPGRRPADWKPLAPMARESLDEAAVDALRRGELARAFGPAFEGLGLEDPVRLPGAPDGRPGSERMKLVDRVVSIEPEGGPYGLGRIVAEMDIQPEAWHLVCHFIDDRVMPGTLMYECCLHTLRIFLMRMGWVGEAGESGCEPVPEVRSQLRCRGQVLESTKKATYEIWLKELGYGPSPFAIADALMYSDGKPIVLIKDMSLRMTGLDRETLERMWSRGRAVPQKPVLFDTDRILAFAVGKPSEAFGERYTIFDSERVIARLPGPPYQFLDRITAIDGARPWELAAGGVVTAEYDVPPDAWYFRANRRPSMPFGVALEVALQPCGWLAAYLGSALHGDEDLSFRNLGGAAVLLEDIGPEAGTLETKVKITKVSKSGGMIIQNFDFEIFRRGRSIYKGGTNFGFFTKRALAQQVGILGPKPYAPTPDELARAMELRFEDPPPASEGLPMPTRDLRMIDSVPVFVADGGPHGLGFLRGVKAVDPAEWFFKAHFYQDPVCPGSLGLESFLQLLKAYARERWPEGVRDGWGFEPIALGRRHEWVYRGQVIPKNRLVTVEAVVRSVSEDQRLIVADGFLSVDGLTIYQMKDFAIRALGR